MAALQSHAASRLAGLRVDDGPAAGPDHASLADVVLRGVETFPPYRESFYAASIASAVRAPDFIAIVQAAGYTADASFGASSPVLTGSFAAAPDMPTSSVAADAAGSACAACPA